MSFRQMRLLIAGLVLAGCGSDSTGSPGGGDPAIAVTLSPTTATVAQGSSTQVGATLTRTNFTGAVTVVVTGAPTGLTATANVTNGGATINITATSSVVIGSYPMVVKVSGSGVADVTKNFTLNVVALGSAYFTLSVNPTDMTVPVGGNGSATIDISRVGFSGAVSFSVDGAPAYMSASAAASSAASATLNITTTNAVQSGTYYLSIRGSAAGQTDVTIQLYVTVP